MLPGYTTPHHKPPVGLEPTTCGLQNRRSTFELRRLEPPAGIEPTAYALRKRRSTVEPGWRGRRSPGRDGEPSRCPAASPPSGAGDGSRTHDGQLGGLALCQLSYSRIRRCAADLRNPSLYRESSERAPRSLPSLISPPGFSQAIRPFWGPMAARARLGLATIRLTAGCSTKLSYLAKREATLAIDGAVTSPPPGFLITLTAAADGVGVEAPGAPTSSPWWAKADSNRRPLAYQASALTS